jgi:hypothetical protein
MGTTSPTHGSSWCYQGMGAPKVLLDHKGKHVYIPKVILVRFFEYFVGVLGGW